MYVIPSVYSRNSQIKLANQQKSKKNAVGLRRLDDTKRGAVNVPDKKLATTPL